jgi:hypothetical protein
MLARPVRAARQGGTDLAAVEGSLAIHANAEMVDGRTLARAVRSK